MSGVSSTNQNVMISVSARDLTGNTFNRLNAAMNTLAGNMRHAAVQMTVAGTGMLHATAPILAFFKDAINVGVEYEAQMLRTLGAFSTELKSQEQFMQAQIALTEEANRVGVKYALSNLEAAQALEVLGKTGRSVNQAISELEAVTQFAEANNYDLAKSAELVAVAMTIFSKEGVTAEQVTGALTAAQLSSAQSIEDIAVAFRHGAGAIASVNIPLEQYAAGLGIAANAGIKGAMAGTQFRSMITRMIKPTAEAREVTEALGIEWFEAGSDAEGAVVPIFELEKQMNTLFSTMTKGEKQQTLLAMLSDLGISTVDLTGKTLTATDAQKVFLRTFGDIDMENAEQVDQMAEVMANYGLEMFDFKGKIKDLPQLFADLNDKMSGLSDTQKQAVLTTLFTQRGFALVNAMMSANTDEWAEMTAAVADGENALQRLTDIVHRGVGYALEVLRGNLEVIKTIIFDIVKGPLAVFVAGLIAMSEAFVNASRPIQQFVVGILALVAAVGGILAPLAILIGMLTFAFTVPAAIPIMLALTAAIGVFAAILAVAATRTEDFKKAIQPAIDALKLLNDELGKGASANERSVFTAIADFLASGVIFGIEKLARAIQILVDIFITFRQAFAGNWTDHPDVYRLTAIFGTLGHIFRQMIPIAGKVADAIRKAFDAFKLVQNMYKLRDATAEAYRVMQGGKPKVGFLDSVNDALEEIERKLVRFNRKFDSEYAPVIERYGEHFARIYYGQILPAVQRFVDQALIYLNRFANWFNSTGGPQLAEWAGRFADWFVIEGLPNFIDNLIWVIELYIDMAKAIDDVYRALKPVVLAFWNFNPTVRIMRELVDAITGSSTAMAIFNFFMRAFLALRIGIALAGAAIAAGAFALAMGKILLAGPLRAIGLFITALGWMRGAFGKADVAKDKHLKNQTRLQRVFKASVLSVGDLAKALRTKLVAAFSAASAAVLGYIQNLLWMRQVSNMQTPPLPTTRRRSVTTVVQNFVTQGTNLLGAIAGAVRSKTITVTQKFVTLGTVLLDAIKGAASKSINMVQNFITNGKVWLGDINKAKSKAINMIQNFITNGVPWLKEIELAKSKTITVTQNFTGAPPADLPTPSIDSEKVGSGAGKGAASSFISSFLGFLAGAKANVLAGGIRSLLTRAIAATAGKGLHGTVAALVLALILGIILAIENPEYVAKIGNAIVKLLDGGIAYGIGYAAGMLVRWSVEFANLMNGIFESAFNSIDIAGLFEKLFAISFPSIAIAIKVPDIMEAVQPIVDWIRGGLEGAINFITGPALTFAQNVWTAIGTALSTTWGSITNIFSVIWGEIVTTFTVTLPELFSGIGTAIWEAIGTSLSASWNTFTSILHSIFIQLPTEIINIIRETLGPPLTAFFEALWSMDLAAIWQAGVDLLYAIFVTLPTRIWEAISTKFEEIRTSLSTWWSTVQEAWQTAWDEIGLAWDGFVARIKESASNIWEGLTNAWDEIKLAWQTAWNEIGEAWDTFRGKIEETASSMWDGVLEAWEGLKSAASGVVESIGEAWDGLVGIIEGIESELSEQWESMKQGFEDALGPEATQQLKDGWNELKTLASDVWGGISEAVSTAASGIGEAAGSISGFVGDVISSLSDLPGEGLGHVTGFADEAGASISGFVTDNIPKITGFVTDFVTELKRIITEGAQPFVTFAYDVGVILLGFAISMYTAGKDAIQSLIDGMKALFGEAVNAILALKTAIILLFSGAVGWLKSAGEDIVNGLKEGIEAAKEGALAALRGVIGALKAIPGADLVMKSPSKVFEQFGRWILEGLAIGITEEEATATKAMSDAIKAVTDAASAIYELSELLTTKRLMPIDPEKMMAVANEGAKAFGILRDAIADIGYSEEESKAYTGRVDMVTKAVEAFQKIFELLQAIAENESDITNLADTFGTLKLALEKAIDELNLMFAYLGDDKIFNSSIAISSATAIGEGFTAIVEMLIAMQELGGYINFEMIGQLKLALERAIDELNLMFLYLGHDKVQNATEAVAVAKDIGEGFTAIIEMISALARLGSEVQADIDKIGELKLVLERAIYELHLMFNYFQNGEIANAGKIAVIADDIGKGFEAIVKFVRLLNTNILVTFDVSKIDALVHLLTVSVKALGDAFLEVGQPFIDNAEVFATSGLAVAKALIETFKLLGQSAKTGVTELPPGVIDTLVATLVSMVQKVSGALNDIEFGLLEPSKLAAETAKEIADSLIGIFELLGALSEKPEVLSADAKIQVLVDTLTSIMQKFKETIDKNFAGIDEETLLTIGSFGEAAEGAIGAIGTVLDTFTMSAQELNSRVENLPGPEIISKLTDFILMLVAGFDEVQFMYEEEGLAILESFTGATGNILEAIGSIPDALDAIAKFKEPSEKKLAAVINYLKFITNELIDAAGIFSEDVLKSAGLFIDTAGKILDAFGSIPEAMEGIRALIPMTESKMAQIKKFFIQLGQTFLEIARSFTEDDLAEIEAYVETIQKALDLLEKSTNDVKESGAGTGSGLASAGKSIAAGSRTAAQNISGASKELSGVTQQLQQSLSGGVVPKDGIFQTKYNMGIGKWQVFSGGLLYVEVNGTTPFDKSMKLAEEKGLTGGMGYQIMNWMKEAFKGTGLLMVDRILEANLWVGGGNFASEGEQSAWLDKWISDVSDPVSHFNREAEKFLQRVQNVVNLLWQEPDLFRIGSMEEALYKSAGFASKQQMMTAFFGGGLDIKVVEDAMGNLLYDVVSKGNYAGFVKNFEYLFDELDMSKLSSGLQALLESTEKMIMPEGAKIRKKWMALVRHPDAPWNLPDFTDEERNQWIREQMLVKGTQPLMTHFRNQALFTAEEIKKANALAQEYGQEMGKAFLRAKYGFEEYRAWIYDRPAATYGDNIKQSTSRLLKFFYDAQTQIDQLKKEIETPVKKTAKDWLSGIVGDFTKDIMGGFSSVDQLKQKLYGMLNTGEALTAENFQSKLASLKVNMGGLQDFMANATGAVQRNLRAVREDMRLAKDTGASFSTAYLAQYGLTGDRYIIGTINLGGVNVTGTGDPLLDGAIAGQAAMQAIIQELEARNS